MGKKRIKAKPEAHSTNSKYGMGDSYGTGVKAKVGRSIHSSFGNVVSTEKMDIPPRSLA